MTSAILVEDDPDIAAAVVDYLALEDIRCDYAANGAAGLELLRSNTYDVLILDINLPRMSGYEVCNTLRDDGLDVPILMLTARDTLDDKLKGFDAGTDDYLVKPFAMVELTARVRALAGRRSSRASLLRVAELELQPKARLATLAGEPLPLSPKGLALLEALMRASPEAVGREQLVDAAWGDDQPDSNSLNVHMHGLRKMLNRPGKPALVHTVAGFGYALKES